MKQKRKMDSYEQKTESYLTGLQIGSVVFEPDGNNPPDFLVDKRIAVEVRRLDQNRFEDGKIRSLEQTSISIDRMIRKVAQSFGNANSGKSWSYVVRLRKRPDKTQFEKLKKDVQKWFGDFRTDPDTKNSRFLSDFVELQIFDSFTESSQMFNFGLATDHRATCFTLPALVENIDLCLHEKTMKVAQYLHLYPEWWLVLVEDVGFGLNDGAMEILRQQLQPAKSWSRILILDRSCAFSL